jgi:hypothetical protein
MHLPRFSNVTSPTRTMLARATEAAAANDIIVIGDCDYVCTRFGCFLVCRGPIIVIADW